MLTGITATRVLHIKLVYSVVQSFLRYTLYIHYTLVVRICLGYFTQRCIIHTCTIHDTPLEEKFFDGKDDDYNEEYVIKLFIVK